MPAPAALRHPVRMRADYQHAMPEAGKAMAALVREVRRSGLEPALVELVKIRASQLNGCAHCVETHVGIARAKGEDETRLHLIAVWRDAGCYTERERAALAWCDRLTLVAGGGVTDADYAELAEHFTEQEVVALTYAIVQINGSNRLAIAFGPPESGAPALRLQPPAASA
jgi:AhpD family alkylhydroperoxidase